MSATPAVRLLDVRGLPPPEPLEHVLDALDTLAPGEQLCMRIEREPHPLYRILANNGYCHRTTAHAAHDYEVRIWQAAGVVA